MAAKQSLSIDQRISMRLSAQQLRFVRLLELNTPELEEAVEREIEDNPALAVEDPAPVADKETPYYRMYARNGSPDDTPYDFAPADTGDNLYDHLLRQLAEKDLSDNEEKAARYIIGSLDPNGYLRRPLHSIVDDMDFRADIHVSMHEAEEALKAVTELEPYGVGASDLRECLRLQLVHIPKSETRDDALDIIDRQFEAFTMKHTHKIISGLKISKERVKRAIELILTLNPKPGAAINTDSDNSNIVIPDIIINDEDGELTVSTNNSIPELQVSRSFADAMAEMEANGGKSRNNEAEFVVARYNDARDFIRIMKQRQETLLDVMTAIMKIQKDYFTSQDVYKLKPMMLKDIAAITGLDLSVISRATNNKYVATPWGVFPLRFFFSDSIGDDDVNSGDSSDPLTNRKIEAEIMALVNAEDKAHPLSDEKIKQEMEARGYDVSRRTVAKYRDRVGIPVARLRKNL